MSNDDLKVVKCYVDASFAFHPDFKSDFGAIVTMVQVAMQSVSRKQNLYRSVSTEAELFFVDDISGYIMWTVLFIEWKCYNISKNVMYQDNNSAILLGVNGSRSAGKRIWALGICYFL